MSNLQSNTYKYSEKSSVCRSYPNSKFLRISNSTAQDEDLSPEALGILVDCLSRGHEWIFNPKTIWKKRKLGRDKIYRIFNELIKNYRCIRIKLPNPENPNLHASVEYEFYDDPNDCKERIEFLKKQGKYFDDPEKQDLKKRLPNPGFQDADLKKCLPHPGFQDSASQDVIYKDYNNINTDVVVVSKSLQKGKIPDKKSPPVRYCEITSVAGVKSKFSFEDLMTRCTQEKTDWTAEEIEVAWSIICNCKGPITDWFGFIKGTINTNRVKKQNQKNQNPGVKKCPKPNQNIQNLSKPLEISKEFYSENDMRERPLALLMRQRGRKK